MDGWMDGSIDLIAAELAIISNLAMTHTGVQ